MAGAFQSCPASMHVRGIDFVLFYYHLVNSTVRWVIEEVDACGSTVEDQRGKWDIVLHLLLPSLQREGVSYLS